MNGGLMKDKVEKFLKSEAFGVVGASENRQKFGNKVLRCYIQRGLNAIPVNPRVGEIEGVRCVPGVEDLPESVKSISVVTPPPVTEKVVAAAIRKGISNIWMQPGAESPAALDLCRKNNINVIADGTCILVELDFEG
jgi:predicted CoA-binding protein